MQYDLVKTVDDNLYQVMPFGRGYVENNHSDVDLTIELKSIFSHQKRGKKTNPIKITIEQYFAIEQIIRGK
jgi:hypothetical protein